MNDNWQNVLTEGKELLDSPGKAHKWLNETRRSEFLLSLPDSETRNQWADTAVDLIHSSNYTLESMMNDRVAEHPDRTLFHDPESDDSRWSYAQVLRQARKYAATFIDTVGKQPRVAFITPNSLHGAICDIGCLLHGILVMPLSPVIGQENLLWVLEKMEVNIIVSGGLDQHHAVASALDQFQGEVKHFTLDNFGPAGSENIVETANKLSTSAVDSILEKQPRLQMDDTATVLFTSGSTGKPKGVVFTIGNMVTKRFARAAALPEVGVDEKLLCFLPLYHTFGRFLEMLGMLFWGGTYVFVGNPSADTLLSRLKEIQPTGLISIPLRWTQIRAACGDDTSNFREVTGERLRWGLSAAGYLDPRVFRFFHRNGVKLCSGFGMTEATGGITMTPPDDYKEGSVGVPLPAVNIELSEDGEMLISGPYIARYLDDDSEGPLPTGDIFKKIGNGHLEIIDRVKDIYKNTRGQTIAPRKVEQKFADVPGIKRVFLVGDHRNSNVLLIVPERDDPILTGASDETTVRDYFRQIITAANEDLANRERVINFAILDRDFSIDNEELTPKGSYKRKNIEENFKEVIDDLYQNERLSLEVSGYSVQIPRWIFRDLGILESDITVQYGGLYDRHRGLLLKVTELENGLTKIGDLIYKLQGKTFNLGRLSRQPLLWAGNLSLANFCPVKDGWDTPQGTFSNSIYLPQTEHEMPSGKISFELPAMNDRRLPRIHELSHKAMFGEENMALKGIAGLQRALEIADHNSAYLIRRRLETLARHQSEEVRCQAYKILLLDEPSPDYSQNEPTFLESGLPFLNQQTIKEIAAGGMGDRRLAAFRRRLDSYRAQLEWPISDSAREQFKLIFELLVNLVKVDPSFYAIVREELVSWILHREDDVISKMAEKFAFEIAAHYENSLTELLPQINEASWKGKLIFQDGMSEQEISRLKEVLIGTTFLQQSILLSTDGQKLDLREVPQDGIWVSRTAVRHSQRLYRLSITATTGKHYDLLISLWNMQELDTKDRSIYDTIYWMIALSGYPHGNPSLPRFGCFRPELGALSLAYLNDLNAWERIREYSSGDGVSKQKWQQLFTGAFTTCFRGWLHSDKQIVPGMITPKNVVVSEPDFRERAKLLSLTGWKKYTRPLDLIQPIIHNFYKQTAMSFTSVQHNLDLQWIADACVDALGREDAARFLSELQEDLQEESLDGYRGALAREISEFLPKLETEFHICATLRNAINRFNDWEIANPEATAKAKNQVIDEMYGLYGMSILPHQSRFHLYRNCWFNNSEDQIKHAFDRLLHAMHLAPEKTVSGMVQLSDLQALLSDEDDITTFNHMVFPHSQVSQKHKLTTVGDDENRYVIVTSDVSDRQGGTYTVREPLEPAEIGLLYRLFFKSGYYKTISTQDQFLVLADADGQVAGGISWHAVDDKTVHLNGIVVSTPLLGKGLSSVLIEDFCTRLANMDYTLVKTVFVLRPFFEKHGFRLDRKWGGLVRSLEN
ncbi:MAG: GNAT family N-acetyltransferase [bacterium]|nr:GNAT family N-acetyltransferase [bacterium]MCP4800149.1 GNAT family N-acetyltransferase [bacterium]